MSEDRESLEIDLSKVDPPVVKNRLTMVLNIHHEHVGEQPFSLAYQLARFLETEHEPYSRRRTVHHDPQLLYEEKCWIPAEDVGLVSIENLEGKHLVANPSAAERGCIALRTVEVWLSSAGPPLLIPPGWQQHFFPSAVETITIRCQSGMAKCKITLLPK